MSGGVCQLLFQGHDEELLLFICVYGQVMKIREVTRGFCITGILRVLYENKKTR